MTKTRRPVFDLVFMDVLGDEPAAVFCRGHVDREEFHRQAVLAIYRKVLGIQPEADILDELELKKRTVADVHHMYIREGTCCDRFYERCYHWCESPWDPGAFAATLFWYHYTDPKFPKPFAPVLSVPAFGSSSMNHEDGRS